MRKFFSNYKKFFGFFEDIENPLFLFAGFFTVDLFLKYKIGELVLREYVDIFFILLFVILGTLAYKNRTNNKN